jgi:hypothetical protein
MVFAEQQRKKHVIPSHCCYATPLGQAFKAKPMLARPSRRDIKNYIEEKNI